MEGELKVIYAHHEGLQNALHEKARCYNALREELKTHDIDIGLLDETIRSARQVDWIKFQIVIDNAQTIIEPPG